MVVILVCLGCSFGRSDDSPPPTPARTVVVTETKEVEKQVKVPAPYVPSECKKAAEIARELNALVGKYEAAMGKQSEIMGDAYTAMEADSVTKLNDASQRLFNLKAETIGILGSIREKNDSLAASLKDCNQRLAR